MKTILMLMFLMIACSLLASAASLKTKLSGQPVPHGVVMINLKNLQNKTANISMLKPVFVIISSVETIKEKLHRKSLRLVCNKTEPSVD